MSLHGDDGPSRSLHAIEAGGHALVMMARQRIGRLLDTLDSGEFREAFEVSQQITAKLQPLANAEAYMAIASDSRLVRARDLAVGMVLTDVGEITEFELHECPVRGCTGHVKFKIGTHEAGYDGDVELYVRNESGD